MLRERQREVKGDYMNNASNVYGSAPSGGKIRSSTKRKKATAERIGLAPGASATGGN